MNNDVDSLKEKLVVNKRYYHKKNNVALAKNSTLYNTSNMYNNVSKKTLEKIDSLDSNSSSISWGQTAINFYLNDLRPDSLLQDRNELLSVKAKKKGFYNITSQAIKQSLISGTSFIVRLGSNIFLFTSDKVAINSSIQGTINSLLLDCTELSITIDNNEIDSVYVLNSGDSYLLYVEVDSNWYEIENVFAGVNNVRECVQCVQMFSTCEQDGLGCCDGSVCADCSCAGCVCGGVRGEDSVCRDSLGHSLAIQPTLKYNNPTIDNIKTTIADKENIADKNNVNTLNKETIENKVYVNNSENNDCNCEHENIENITNNSNKESAPFTISDKNSFFAITPITATSFDTNISKGFIGRSLLSRSFCNAVENGIHASQMIRQTGIFASFNQNLLILQGVNRLVKDSRTGENLETLKENSSKEQGIPTLETESMQGDIRLEKLASPDSEQALNSLKVEASNAASSLLLPISTFGFNDVQVSGDFLVQQKKGFDRQVSQMRESLSFTLKNALILFMDAQGEDWEDYINDRDFCFLESIPLDTMSAFADGVYKLKEVLGDAISNDSLVRKAGFSEYDRLLQIFNEKQ